MKKRIAVAALSMFLAFGLTSVCFAAGSIAHGNLDVYKSGQLADKLSGQNPVEEGSLMVCDGKCMIKSEGISLVAADQAKFAIQNEDSVFNLFVREGQINYVVSDNSRKIAFHTPSGTYSVAEVVFNAGSSPVVKGSVLVNDAGETEISVTEGRMVFATADGMQTVDANHKIVLAIAEVGGATAVAAGGGVIAGEVVAIGAAGAIFAAAAVVEIDENDSGSDAAAAGASASGAPSAPAPVPAVMPSRPVSASPNS